MIEGCGSILMNSGFGSGRPENMWSRSGSGRLRGAEDSRIFRWSGYMCEGPKFTHKPGFLPFRKAFVYFPCKNLTFYDFHLARNGNRICICFAPWIRIRIEIISGSRSALKPMQESTQGPVLWIRKNGSYLVQFPVLYGSHSSRLHLEWIELCRRF